MRQEAQRFPPPTPSPAEPQLCPVGKGNMCAAEQIKKAEAAGSPVEPCRAPGSPAARRQR